MEVVALAGGIGAGKFLRGLAQLVPGAALTVIVNVADDVVVHGLHVSPDPDSIVYWLSETADRERGWGRRDETFRATEELRRLGAADAWFSLGDLDLATHLFRTSLLDQGLTLSQATARIATAFGVQARVIPVTDDRITTRIGCLDAATGETLDLHFQEYWVARRARDPVLSVTYVGAEEAGPAEGVLESIEAAGAVVVCPSNPVVSIGPILAVPGVREALIARRDVTVGVSGIVGEGPVSGMADRLMPALGIEVSAAGVAEHYRDLLSAWVMDQRDVASVPRVEGLGIRCRTIDTIMADDVRARAVAEAALELVR